MDLQANLQYNIMVKTFQEYLKEASVRVVGGIYKNNSDEEIHYEGINFHKTVLDILDRSIKVKDSYVSMRDIELLLAKVQDVRFSIQIVKTEMKSILNKKEISRNPNVSSQYASMKECFDKVSDYLEICDKMYTFISETSWGISLVNTAINKRFYNGDDVGYHYKDETN